MCTLYKPVQNYRAVQVNQKLKMEYRAGPKSTGDKIRQCLHNSLPKKKQLHQPYIVARESAMYSTVAVAVCMRVCVSCLLCLFGQPYIPNLLIFDLLCPHSFCARIVLASALNVLLLLPKCNIAIKFQIKVTAPAVT